ncbi:MAG: ROK family protein [Chloroflexota bacterium]|jgi:glucokinase|nr:ROK family protein [Chloroflexota bacterium]
MVNRSTASLKDELGTTTKILGLNVSGDKTIGVYGDMNGLIYERIQMETPAELPFLEGFDAVCTMVDKLLKLCRAQGLSSPEVISLAVSGPVDLLKGVVLSPPDLPLWGEGQLKGRLSVRYNLPVFIEHRSSAAALAEFHFGNGSGMDDMIFLDLEPVVSAGLIINGDIYHGANDAAGEIGKMHMANEGPSGLGTPGSLTGFASGHGMAELASLRYSRIWPEAPRPYDLVKAVNGEQPEALQVVHEAADHLGKALLWLIYAFDPEMVIVGHPGDVMGEALLTPLRESVLRHGGGDARQLPKLMAAKLGAKLDDTAALMSVIHQFKNQSSP